MHILPADDHLYSSDENNYVELGNKLMRDVIVGPIANKLQWQLDKLPSSELKTEFMIEHTKTFIAAMTLYEAETKKMKEKLDNKDSNTQSVKFTKKFTATLTTTVKTAIVILALQVNWYDIKNEDGQDIVQFAHSILASIVKTFGIRFIQQATKDTNIKPSDLTKFINNHEEGVSLIAAFTHSQNTTDGSTKKD